MDNFAQALAQPEMVFVFVFIILLVALIPLYQAIFNINLANRDLKTATDVLLQLGKNQDEFYNQFKSIHTQILKIPGLRHAWRQFVDSLYFESQALQTPHKKVYLSHRPSHYFNRESVLGTRLNLFQFFAYPNYLIGIGLTFTFIGLAAALHVAQAGLATGAGQEALKDLLAVASVKFISSIAGIVSSLFISSLQRIRIKAFEQQLEVFCDLLEESTKYKSTEKLLHDSLNEQRVQTAVFNDLGKNIAAGLSEAISRELSSGVTNAMEPLTRDLKTLAQTFAKGSEEALKAMLAEFTSELHKRSASEMQELTDRIHVLKTSLEELTGSMQSAGKELSAHVGMSTARLSETLGNIGTALAPVQRGLTQLDQSLSSLETVAGNIGQAGSVISSTAADHKKTADAFEKVVADVSAKLTQMGESLAGLSQLLGKVEETALHLREASGDIATAAGGFKDSAALSERSQGAFSQKIKLFENLAQQLSGVITSLEKLSHQASQTHVAPKDKNNYLSKLKMKWRK